MRLRSGVALRRLTNFPATKEQTAGQVFVLDSKPSANEIYHERLSVGEQRRRDIAFRPDARPGGGRLQVVSRHGTADKRSDAVDWQSRIDGTCLSAFRFQS